MPLNTQFLNTLLDSGVQGIHVSGGGIWVGLYNSGSVTSTNPLYSHQYITGFNMSSGGIKYMASSISFAPTGDSQDGWPYNQIRLYTSGTGTLLGYIDVSPSQFIPNLDAHQILLNFSGVSQ